MAGPFDEFVEVFKQMTPEHKKKLIENHQRFSFLRSFCLAKGYIEELPKLQGFKVLKNTDEVKELKKVIDVLQPGSFKWIDDTKT